MNTKEAWERIIEGNFNNGYGFDLQMLVDCMGIVSKAIKDGEIIPTQAVRDAIAEIEQINEFDYPKDDRTVSKFKGIVIEIIRKHTGISDETEMQADYDLQKKLGYTDEEWEYGKEGYCPWCETKMTRGDTE